MLESCMKVSYSCLAAGIENNSVGSKAGKDPLSHFEHTNNTYAISAHALVWYIAAFMIRWLLLDRADAPTALA